MSGMSFDGLTKFAETFERDPQIVKVAEALHAVNMQHEEEMIDKTAERVKQVIGPIVAEMLDQQVDIILEKIATSVLAGTGTAQAPLTASLEQNVGEGSEDGKVPVITAEEVRGATEEAAKDPNANTAQKAAEIVSAVVKVNGPEHAPAAADTVKEVIRQAVSNQIIPVEEGEAAAAAADQAAAAAVGE